MNILLTEIFAFLLATALLSFIVGWGVKSVFVKNKLKTLDANWRTKHTELEQRHKLETTEIENQLQTLGEQSKYLTKENRQLNESLRTNELTVQKARTDAIELNKQQATTQERLQRIIHEKDAELKRLRNNNENIIASGVAITSANADTNTDHSAQVRELNEKQQKWESQRQEIAESLPEDMQTIAIDPSDLPLEAMDRTVRIDIANAKPSEQSASLPNSDIAEDQTQILEDYDSTQIVNEFADETVVLPTHSNNIEDNNDLYGTQPLSNKDHQADRKPPYKK